MRRTRGTIIDFARLYIRSKPVNLIRPSTGALLLRQNPCRAPLPAGLSGNIGIPGGTSAFEAGIELAPGWGTIRPCRFRPYASRECPDIQVADASPGVPVGKIHRLPEKLDKGEMTVKEYQQLIGNVPDGRPLPNVKMLLHERQQSHRGFC